MPSAFGAGSFSGFDSWSSFPLSSSCLKKNPSYQSGNQIVLFTILLGFVQSRETIGLKKSRHFVIQSENKTNRDSVAPGFPRFASATSICFEFWLAPWIVCPSWLAKGITLVLILRHSIENLSKRSRTILTPEGHRTHCIGSKYEPTDHFRYIKIKHGR